VLLLCCTVSTAAAGLCCDCCCCASGETSWGTLRRWNPSKALLPFVERLSHTADEDPPLGAEADYLLFPLNRQHPCKHWVLAALDLRTKQFTLLDSLARQDKRAILAKAEVARLQEYLDHLAVREHDKPIDWADSLFPAEQPPQQYDLHDPRKKLAGIDCGLFCLFYAVALSYGGELTFSQEDMPVLRQRAIQLVVGQTSFI
jgi:hypothetical protein